MGVCASNSAGPAKGGSKVQRKPNAANQYVEEKTLGMGASCTVVIAQHKESGRRYAMKKLGKPPAKDCEDNDYLFHNEVEILRELKHPNIVRFEDAFEDDDHYFLLTDLCTGGELFDRIAEGQFSEQDASRLTKHMLKALAHCHSRNVVHRDLKPENLIFTNKNADSALALIDFGCALKKDDEEVIDDVAGSPYYVAPEVLTSDFKRTGRVWKASDMWSIGVIVFLLVHGYPPFNAQNQSQIFRKIRVGKYRFSRDIQLSKDVKDFIRKLLLKAPHKRMTAEEALNHAWVRNVEEQPAEPLPQEVVKSLLDFGAQCKLKKAVGRLVADQMSDKDRENLQELFQRFDENGDGELQPDEIVKMLEHIGRPASDVTKVMEEYDEDGDGAIQFDEFATAMGAGQLDDEKQARILFNQLDKDGSGDVSVDELVKALNLNPEEARQMVAEVDKNNDGAIDFNEWLEAMGTKKHLLKA